MRKFRKGDRVLPTPRAVNAGAVAHRHVVGICTADQHSTRGFSHATMPDVVSVLWGTRKTPDSVSVEYLVHCEDQPPRDESTEER
jgi:hypothetical protein